MNLSKRQKQIVELLAQGYTGQEVADILCCALPTVRRHLQIACQRQGARNTAHLIALSISRGFIKPLCLLLIVAMCDGSQDSLRRNAPRRLTQRLDDISAIVI